MAATAITQLPVTSQRNPPSSRVETTAQTGCWPLSSGASAAARARTGAGADRGAGKASSGFGSQGPGRRGVSEPLICPTWPFPDATTRPGGREVAGCDDPSSPPPAGAEHRASDELHRHVVTGLDQVV